MKRFFLSLVAVSCLVGSVTVTGLQAQDSESFTLPKPIYQVEPKHPEEHYEAAVEGQAVISLTVDAFGSVINPKIESATHEEFGLAAMLAVSEWVFEPATRDGKPIAMKVQLPFVFSLSFEHKLNKELGREIFVKIDEKPVKASDLERPPAPRHVPDFTKFYPEALKGSGKSSSASASFIIAPDGKVINPRIKSVSTEGFEEAALRAVCHLRYNPVFVNGEAAYVSMTYLLQITEGL